MKTVGMMSMRMSTPTSSQNTVPRMLWRTLSISFNLSLYQSCSSSLAELVPGIILSILLMMMMMMMMIIMMVMMMMIISKNSLWL